MPLHPALALFGLHAHAAMFREHQLGAEILVVHADQALRRAPLDQWKVLHRVRIGAELAVLRIHRIGGQPVHAGHAARIEIGRAGYETVTPARDDVVAITIGNHEIVARLRRDAFEARGRGRRALRRNLRTCGQTGTRDCTGEQRATRQARRQDRFEGGPLHGRAC